MSVYPIQFYLFIAVVLGLMVGSFLNVVIHRLPKMMEVEFRRECALLDAEELPDNLKPVYNLAVPRSACPGCQKQIAAYDNIPVVSWLLLRGRCRHCGTPISVRYPTVELISAGAAVLALLHFGPGLAAASATVFSWFLIALFFIDADTYLLPDSLTLPLLWLGLLLNLGGMFAPLVGAVLGAATGYLALWSVYWLFKLATGKEGMGYGDFKLLAALGAWLGWQSLPILILLSSLVGAVLGIGFIVLAKRDAAKPLPFGPYLAMAGLITMYWGKPLNHLIWSGSW